MTNKKYPILMQYNIQGETIREVTHAKYLGVTIDQHLSWSEHIKQITNKAYKVKGFLQRNLYSCPPSVKSNCYKALIKPILDYHNLGTSHPKRYYGIREGAKEHSSLCL